MIRKNILLKENERIRRSLKITISVLRILRSACFCVRHEKVRVSRKNKSAISRIENHSEDIRLSTLRKYAEALGKEIRLEIA